MTFDFKREFRQYYLPGRQPELVNVPVMRFVAVRGRGNPNEPDGAYQRALAVLYAVSYTLKMSARIGRELEGFFDYVVPPLEGFWRQEGAKAFDPACKDALSWISCIRLPEFVTEADFRWAVDTASRKKKLDCTGAEFLTLEEGLCAQCMHAGAYDDEPATLAMLNDFIREQGCVMDDSGERWHHEIYLSDPRRTAPEKLRTVLRLPVRRREQS